MTLAEEIYGLYPRKVGKQAALRAIRRVLTNHDGNWIKQRTAQFAASPAGQHDGLFYGYHPPHPSTWFNQGRYDDDEREWFMLDKQRAEELRRISEANVGVWK